MTAAPVQAGAPLPVLVTALAREGWGELAGAELAGCRRVLVALSQVCDAINGTATATAAQVAEAAGLSLKWTRTKLAELEALGLVVWRRGDLVCGRPRPGWFKVRKRAVWALVVATREAGDKARRAADRARQTADRIASTLRWSTQRNKAKHRITPSRADGKSLPPFSLTGELVTPLRGASTPPPPQKDEPMNVSRLFDRQGRPVTPPATTNRTTAAPAAAVPGGSCDVCALTWAAHTARESKLPPELRHDWVPNKPRTARTQAAR